jgi:hypothetical protein
MYQLNIYNKLIFFSSEINIHRRNILKIEKARKVTKFSFNKNDQKQTNERKKLNWI